MTQTITVGFVLPDGERTVRASGGATLLEAAQAAGIAIDATCGARGRCRSCRVKILAGEVPPPTLQDALQLGQEEVSERFRLACQTKIVAECKIAPMPPATESGHQILSGGGYATNTKCELDSGVAKRAVTATVPTDERDKTSDLDAIFALLPASLDRQLPLDILRKVPGALREAAGHVTITTFNDRVIDIEPGDTTSFCYGMAFDIGTTSIVATLHDLASGEELASVGGLNPQAQFGGDLISRIAFAQFDPKKLQTLRARVLNAVNDFIKQACEEAGVGTEHVYKIVVVGNTCMHHLFLGIDVTHLGFAPYPAVVRDSLVYPSAQLPLKAAPNAQVCMLPVVAGFVGADTVGCALATRIYESDEIRALVDIGTNGEVVLGSRKRLLTCSLPAGPAFEGAQIRHGMRAALGAIEKVSITDDVWCKTIGDLPAIGICGSGLIDACAEMIAAGILDETGLMRREDMEALPKALRARLRSGGSAPEFVLAWQAESGGDHDIVLTQEDIRHLQLAKGAIYSGLLSLQRIMRVSDAELAEVMLCGAFGNYVNVESAMRIKLIPRLPSERVTYMGNAAAIGAQLALLSETERLFAFTLAGRMEHVALAGHADFEEVFAAGIGFAGEDA